MSNKFEKKLLKSIDENKGLWANIHAKRKRGEPAAKKGSKAYKKAKAAGKKINKEHCGNEHWESYDVYNEETGIGYTLEFFHGKDDLSEAEYQGRDVKLNKPMGGDTKKFKVYVNSGKKNKDGTIKVKKVEFGQKGARIKKSNPERRKSFRARHNCDNPGPKTKARYWSCRKW
jgi:hypothetical protein